MDVNDTNDCPDILAIGLGFAVMEMDFPPVGSGVGVCLDAAALGRHRPCGAVVAATGANDMAARPPQTGGHGDSSAWMEGHAAVDTLHACPARTGDTMVLFYRPAVDIGLDGLGGLAVAPAHRPVSEDLSVSVILHRIETFSFLDPKPVVLRTGCAR